MKVQIFLIVTLLIIALPSFLHGYVGDEKLQPFAVERQDIDFYPREVKQIDYFAEMCSKQNVEKSVECNNCKPGVNKCQLPMVGFENYGLEEDEKTLSMSDVVSLTVSSVGALTISAGRCCYNEKTQAKNKTIKWSPSFDSRSLGQSFWATVLNNVKARGVKACTEYTCPPPRFAFSSEDKKSYESKNPLIAMLVNYIGEYNDKNNDGKYSLAVDGQIINKIQLKCMEWMVPKSAFDSNKTSAFVGERSSWTLTNKAFSSKTSPYEACKGVEPSTLAAGTITIVATSTDRATIISDDPNMIEKMILTQKNINVNIKVKNFPFRQTFDPSANIRPRLVFRTMLTSSDNKDAFFVMNDHTILVKTYPTNKRKGYFKWEPTAKVQFPGSTSMEDKEHIPRAPLSLTIETHNQDSIVLPRVPSRSEVPYSALYGLFLDSVIYRHTYKADIGVGGLAYSPSYVEINLLVSYGALPKQKEYFHPGAVMGILFTILMMFCVSGYKGWLVEYDWQTGIRYEKDDIEDHVRRDKRKIISPYLCRKCCKWPNYHVERYPDAGFKYIAPDFLRCCLGVNDD
jgi:hypothetical protein